jgi:HAD superfamily hydrolase (TIGR01509 family)
MSTVPKVVAFDLGKVLVDFDYGLAARRIAARSKLNPDGVRKYIDGSALLFRYETGLISSEEFYREVSAATGFCGDFAEFALLFADIFFPIPPMVEFQAALRKRGFPSYILSNTNDLAVTHIRRRFPFFSNFDGYVLSYEHGVMKPDPKIYEIVERDARCRNTEILYLDDRPENTATAASRGWQVIVHESPEKTLEAVRNLGL